jgi:hypothetical protein
MIAGAVLRVMSDDMAPSGADYSHEDNVPLIHEIDDADIINAIAVDPHPPLVPLVDPDIGVAPLASLRLIRNTVAATYGSTTRTDDSLLTSFAKYLQCATHADYGLLACSIESLNYMDEDNDAAIMMISSLVPKPS